MTAEDDWKLIEEALKYSVEKTVASNDKTGTYPSEMIVENGGQGLMPMRNALSALSRLKAREQREGFVLVPIEPTPEMIGEGAGQMFKNELSMCDPREGVIAIYAAMLAARPKEKPE